MNMYMPIDRHAVANQAETRQANKQARSLVPPGELASRRARSSAAQTCQNESAALYAIYKHTNGMIYRMTNEQTKGNGTMDWHGDLSRGSLLGRRQPELRQPIRLPQEQGAKFTEMAMHEKANRVGLTQNIEAAT